MRKPTAARANSARRPAVLAAPRRPRCRSPATARRPRAPRRPTTAIRSMRAASSPSSAHTTSRTARLLSIGATSARLVWCRSSEQAGEVVPRAAGRDEARTAWSGRNRAVNHGTSSTSPGQMSSCAGRPLHAQQRAGPSTTSIVEPDVDQPGPVAEQRLQREAPSPHASSASSGAPGATGPAGTSGRRPGGGAAGRSRGAWLDRRRHAVRSPAAVEVIARHAVATASWAWTTLTRHPACRRRVAAAVVSLPGAAGTDGATAGRRRPGRVSTSTRRPRRATVHVEQHRVRSGRPAARVRVGQRRRLRASSAAEHGHHHRVARGAAHRPGERGERRVRAAARGRPGGRGVASDRAKRARSVGERIGEQAQVPPQAQQVHADAGHRADRPLEAVRQPLIGARGQGAAAWAAARRSSSTVTWPATAAPPAAPSAIRCGPTSASGSCAGRHRCGTAGGRVVGAVDADRVAARVLADVLRARWLTRAEQLHDRGDDEPRSPW